MSSEKATALVLRVVEFSETSSILTIFTREFGKVRGLAKGARRPKGPFESALDLLCLCRIVFLRKSSDALDLLTEAKLERRFRPRDLSSLYAGYYVAELLSELTDDYDPHPELFDAACETLAGLVDEGRIASLVLRFELTALRVLGHLPSWRLASSVESRSRSKARWPSARPTAACCVRSAEWESDKSRWSVRACCGSWADIRTRRAMRGDGWSLIGGSAGSSAAC